MKIVLLLLLLFTVPNSTLFSQSDEALKRRDSKTFGRETLDAIPSEIGTRIESFFNAVIDLKVSSAFENFLKNSPIQKKNKEIESLIEETKLALKHYGYVKSYQIVSSEYVIDEFLRVRCISLHENYPTRWIFTFYKSPTLGWIVTNIKFDDLSEFFFTDEY